ncbi:Ig-like domain-containing protein, partial [candidate division WOR-3 bacterium]|nr:Ig-like domain-containing protein [candidate division WOR-3 bacterium]
MWTKTPDTLFAAHNATFGVGMNDITVTVTDENSMLIINAIVTVWDTTGADTVYRKGLTNGSGQVTFNNVQFLDGNLNEVMISASKQDYIPYIGNADVVGGVPIQSSIISLFDCARVPIIRPILRFVSTDVEGDDIVYRILIDDNYGFSSPDSFTTVSYPSGDTVNFTFPSDLTDDVTYWWKVKAQDPTGSGYWSGYTSIRSFTVFTPLGANNCSWYQNKNNQMQQNTYYATLLEDDSIRLVPSGATIYDTLYYENFETGLNGWYHTNGQPFPAGWSVEISGYKSSYTPPNAGDSTLWIDSDAAGNVTISDTAWSPSIPVIIGMNTFEYGVGYNYYPTSIFNVGIQEFSGGLWNAPVEMKVYPQNVDVDPIVENIDISVYETSDS